MGSENNNPAPPVPWRERAAVAAADEGVSREILMAQLARLQAQLVGMDEALERAGGGPLYLQLGKAYLILGVTWYYVGIVVHHDARDIVLSPGVIIADSGRFHTALTTGTLVYGDPVDEIAVPRSITAGIIPWNYPIPRQIIG